MRVLKLLLASAFLSSMYCDPQRVEIEGVQVSAMEPCVTSNAQILYWSGMNDSDITAHIYWAQRIGDLKYKYMGLLPNVYMRSREMAPSVDLKGDIYFTCTKSFGKDGQTIWRQSGSNAASAVPGNISSGCGIKFLGGAWTLNMDCGVSPDGDTLYISRAHFTRGEAAPRTARLFIAHKQQDGSFLKDPQSEKLLEQVNALPLQYAPAISADGLELYFTRAVPGKIMETVVSTRTSVSQPFGKPVRVSAIEGFAEAPTLTLNGDELYFHKLDPKLNRFCIYRVLRCRNK